LVLGGALAALSVLLWRYAGRLYPSLCGDFLQFWAAARLNLAGENPFVRERVYALWQAAGWTRTWALVMYNPPWTLTLVLPWALLDARSACILWRLSLLVCVFVSVDYLWRAYGGPVKRRWLAWVVGIPFMPTVIAIHSGQLGLVVLAGAVLFLWGLRPTMDAARREWAAAAALLLISSKPHVLYLFWIALAVWLFTFRRGAFLGKALAVTAAALLIPMLMNPAVLVQYLAAVGQRPPDLWIASAWGSFLRLAFGPEKFWLQFLPSLLAGGIYAVYVWRKRLGWDWMVDLPMLVLWSQITRPYGWTHDLVVTLLPLIAVTAQAAQRGPRALRLALGVYALLQVVMVLAHRFTPSGDHHLVWLPLAIFGVYVLVKKTLARQDLSREGGHHA